jgi:predicted amidohydrolase
MAKINQINPDFVLFPFGRCFSDDIKDAQKEWDEIEEIEYIKQAQLTGATVIMSNYIGTAEINDTSFGGAFVVSAKGEMLASLPLLQEGILYYD